VVVFDRLGGRCSEVADVAKIETGLDVTELCGHSIRFECTSKMARIGRFQLAKVAPVSEKLQQIVTYNFLDCRSYLSNLLIL
jgi:hypothetical protein